MHPELKKYVPIADCIAAQFGSNTEVVLHDYTNGYDQTIEYIVNGHVTGRKIGGCPTDMLFREYAKGIKQPGHFRYVTYAPDGKILRSSSVYLYDGEQRLIGSLCVNQDITHYMELERAFMGLMNTNVFESGMHYENREHYVTSIQELLDSIITQGIAHVGSQPNNMSKNDKMKFLDFLDVRGVFLIQRSTAMICQLLNISKYTLYNYLDEIRSARAEKETDQDERERRE